MDPVTISQIDPSIINWQNVILAFVVVMFVLREVAQLFGGLKRIKKLEDVIVSIKKDTATIGALDESVDKSHALNISIKRDTEWTKNIHDRMDEDGVPVWYVRKSLEAAIEKLATNIDRQTEVFKSLVVEIRTKVS